MRVFSQFLRFLTLAAAIFTTAVGFGQSLSSIQGQVTDPSGAAVPGATVTVTNTATGVSQTIKTDSSGNYLIPALPIGNYDLTVQSSGLEKVLSHGVIVQVGRNTVQNFQLKVAQASETVTVSAEAPVIEASTQTVGQVINQKTVQEIPLNGRHFLDLGLLVPGSVVPPNNGFLSFPLRGQGSFGLNTAGNREDENNIMVNGINLNDMANGQLTFQPSINTVSEFKIDNSSYSADEGRNAGAIVQIATRSGTNTFHGEAFDFVRNDFFDARNFFNQKTVTTKNSSGNTVVTPNPMSPFKRNNFGGNIGGPIWKNKTFFFFSYEGLRQRQGLPLTTTVLNSTDAQSAAASSDPTTRKLAALIPAANNGPDGFLGSAVAPVNIDQWTGDIQHNISERDRLHGYYAFQKDQRKEPLLQGNNLPGFGDTRASHRQIFTFAETHMFSPAVVNEFRTGFNRIHITFIADNKDDPASFGFNVGNSGPIGLPRVAITQTGLRFGGINGFPQGRGDLTTVYSDTLSWLKGKHSFKFGGEYRRVYDNSFGQTPGTITYADVPSFISGTITGFTTTLGNTANHVRMGAPAAFAMDNWRIKENFTLELGLRWEWNQTPTEINNTSVLFDRPSASLVQLGTGDRSDAFQQNWKNFEPRLGFAWDVFGNGHTVLRSGYGYQVDQFMPGIAIFNNPPLAVSYSLTSGSTTAADAINSVKAAGLALATVDPDYKNAYVESYNLNVQQQLTNSMSVMAGYFGSHGTHLRMGINLNQPDPVTGVRPVAALSPSSPIYPSTPTAGAPNAPCPPLPTPCTIGNITQTSGIGTSNYNALWTSVQKHLSRGLQIDGNYTWSKSLDETSQNNSAVSVANSFNIFQDYGPSDYDARHHFSVSAIYDLPFKGNRVVEGWRLSTITTLQSGNPLGVVAGTLPTNTINKVVVAPGVSSSTFTGNTTNRPDLLQPVQLVQQIVAGGVQWFPAASSSVCDPRPGGTCPASAMFGMPVSFVGGKNVLHFGNLARNSILGPDFKNADVSLAKVTKITERVNTEFRAEVFDLFNHPNFGNPGLTAQPGSTSFGLITSTRNPTGDSGSSRQIQLSLKLLF
jgi:carboxypeptidase family protein/TonB-dependent receptor-like protein